MSTKSTMLLAALLLAPSAASAGRCDWFARQADSQTGADVVRTFKQLLSCDKAVAERDFERFMLRASDMETLVPLTLAAIDAEVYNAA